MRIACLTLALVLLAAARAAAQPVAELEKEGDRLLPLGQYELAKSYYKQGLKKDPNVERLWVKYDRAMEGYHELVFGIGDGKAPGSARPPRPVPIASAPISIPAGVEAADEDPEAPVEGEESGEPGLPPEEPVEEIPETPPSVEATPTPAPTPDFAARSPEEVIYLERPIRAGDTQAVAGREEGLPVVVQTAEYDIREIRFKVDGRGTLHVTGSVKNRSDRDFRNPRVFLHLLDSRLVQWSLKIERLSTSPAVLFRGRTSPFDISLPAFNNTVGAFRVYLSY